MALVGELGSGKTVFVKGMAEALGVEGEVISSSFVLMRRYKGRRADLLHVDLYRLTEPEVADLALEEALSKREAVVAVEWGEKAFGLLEMGGGMLEVHFEHVPEGRRITFKPVGGRYEEIVRRLREVVASLP